MALPWLGFAFGCLTARALGRNLEDVIAIAVETGVQNTGVSIVILWNTLSHPVGDLAGQNNVAFGKRNIHFSLS
jgi:predicted Na+-dependent transporter